MAPSAARAAVVAGDPDGVRLEVRDRGRELSARIAPREDREDCRRPPSPADEPWLLRSYAGEIDLVPA